jgi:hypothetical protein
MSTKIQEALKKKKASKKRKYDSAWKNIIRKLFKDFQKRENTTPHGKISSGNSLKTSWSSFFLKFTRLSILPKRFISWIKN